MHAYRFRLHFDENEDFLMDIELKANQTFFDFHNAIKSFCNITTNELASFYLCDDKWRKKKEIQLLEMKLDEPGKAEKDDTQTKPAPLLMEKTQLNTIIDNPHQKFLYVYDFLKMHTFYVELMKIIPTSSNIEYPALIKKEGEISLAKPSGLLGFLEDDEAISIITEDEADSLFDNDGHADDYDDLETKMYYGENDIT
jgi:hypothetical protein